MCIDDAQSECSHVGMKTRDSSIGKIYEMNGAEEKLKTGLNGKEKKSKKHE